MHLFTILLTGLCVSNSVNGFSSFFGNIRSYSCRYLSCCEDNWTEGDFKALKQMFDKEVYGQHIATEIVLSALRGHLKQSSPRSKALTMSFHGRTGVGKNYVATFIKKALFDKNFANPYVQFYSGRLHFNVEREVESYKEKLKKEIQYNVGKCEHTLFVFDEVDKMPPGVLDVVKPFIDHHEHINGVDFRKAIFIFVSNTGGDAIGRRYLELWQKGKKRSDLSLHDFENILRLTAFNEEG